MEIRIQSIHFDADKKLIEFAEKKIGKLAVLYDRIMDAELFLKFENANATVKEKTAEIRLSIPGNDLFASESSFTFEEAIDKAVNSLKKQLKKHKEKLKN